MHPPTLPPDQPPRRLGRALWAVFLVALGLRVWGIDFGLPYDFTPDEIHEILRALKLGAGEFNTESFTKGGLYLLLFVEYGALFAVWWLSGKVDGATDFAIAYLRDPTAFYLLGRLTVALMGAATCLVIFEIGRRVHGWRVGLIAAVIGATTYYHALWSHYINVDIGMTLAVWCSLLAFIVYERQRRLRWLVASGALAGVAIAFKLPGAIVLAPLLLAAATLPRPRIAAKEAGAALLAMAATALVLSPGLVHVVDALPYFFSGLLEAGGGEVALEEAPGLQQAIDDITVYRVGSYFNILVRTPYLLLSLAALLGAVFAVVRKDRWSLLWFALSAVFLTVMYAADRPGNERYLLPIIPALWLLAANGVVHLTGQRSKVAMAAVALIIAAPLYALVHANYMFTRPDTRVMAKQWLEVHVPSHARILMDGMRYRFIQSPPLTPDETATRRRVAQARVEGEDLSRGVSSRQLELYARAMKGMTGPQYDIHSTVWGLAVESLSYYPQACFDYVVTSSTVAHVFAQPSEHEEYPQSAAFYQGLPADPRYQLVYSAAPQPWKVQGPTITVYKVRNACGK